MASVDFVCDFLDKYAFEDDLVNRIEANVQETENELKKIEETLSASAKMASAVGERAKIVLENDEEPQHEDELEDIQEAHKAILIHTFLATIEEINEELRKSTDNFQKAVKTYDRLKGLSSGIQDSGALELKKYVNRCCINWQETLTIPLESALAIELSKIGFPEKISDSSYGDTETLRFILRLLDDLNLPSHLCNDQKAAIVALISPLKKKFKVFFYSGSSKLNDPAKPEYFLSVIYKWITEYQDFIQTVAEEVFVEFSASFAFASELVKIAADKVEHDFALVTDDEVFSHIVDELIANDAELLDFDPTLATVRRPVSVLEQGEIITRWLSLELISSRSMLEGILSHPDGFPIKSEETSRQFFEILQLTNRRCHFLSEERRIEFYFQELEIIDEFRLGLLQLSDVQSISHERICAILNTVGCIHASLTLWDEDRPYGRPLQTMANFQAKHDEVVANVKKLADSLSENLVSHALDDIWNSLHQYNSNQLAHIKDIEQVSSFLIPSLSKIQIHLQQLDSHLLDWIFKMTASDLARHVDNRLSEQLETMSSVVSSNILVLPQMGSDVYNNIVPLFHSIASDPAHLFTKSIGCYKKLQSVDSIEPDVC